MTNNEDEIFDAQFLSRLRKLFLKLRRRRQLRKKGRQSTPSAGFTREFKDRRQYTPGDDFRTIDWRLFARLDKMFIRIFEEVQEYHVYILLDRSRSMREPYPQKRLSALRLTVALAYLALVNEHRVSILTLAEGLRREIPPRKGQGHIHGILRQMATLEFEGVTDLVGSLKQFRPGRDRQGIVFIISDLFGRAPEMSGVAVAQATSWPCETHVVQVLHPLETEPNLEGELQLVEVETDETQRIWFTKRDAMRYREVVDQYLEDLAATCAARQIGYFMWSTDQPFEDMFLNMLAKSHALARK